MARRQHTTEGQWRKRRFRAIALAPVAAVALALPLAAQERPAAANDFGLRGGVPIAAPLSQPERRASGLTAGATTARRDATINYGKPRAKHPSPKGFPPSAQPKPGLPALEPYQTSPQGRDLKKARPLPPVFSPDATPPRIAPPPTVAAIPTLPILPRPRPDNDPFAPTGIGVGNLRLRPFVESGIGYDSNPNRITSPQRGSAFWRGDAGVAVQSDWSRHSLSGSLRGGYYDFFSVPSANRPDGAGAIAGRIDVTRDTAIDVGGSFALDTLRAGSPELIALGTATATGRPLVWTIGGYGGVTQHFNRLELSLRGIVDRSQYGDASFSDGSKQYLSRNDFTTVGIRPRIGYEVSPFFKPFVEATLDKRIYDDTNDVNGYRRSSKGVTVRGGASFEFTPLITGEISGGYVQRDYEDARLTPLRGPVFDASLIWLASPLTTVTLRGATNVAETTIAGASGAISRTIGAEISHALLRNVTIAGTVAFQDNRYDGTDPALSSNGAIREQLFTAGVKAEYHLTRTVVVKASYNHERLKSTVAGSDYTANVFLLGLRLQR